MDFNYYDYIFLALILFSSLLGLARGFWLQVISLGVWVCGGVVYYFFGPMITDHLVAHIMPLSAANWVVLIGTFIVFFFAGFIIRILVNSLLGINTFTFFNKVMGLFLGFFVGVILVLIIVYAVDHSGLDDSEDWQASVIATQMTTITSKYNGFVYERTRDTEHHSTISKDEYAKELA